MVNKSMMKYHNSNRFCSVPQCSSRCTKDVSLFKFPPDRELAKKWAVALRIEREISKFMYVCSLHFVKNDFILPDFVNLRRRLKKGVIPSQNVPQGDLLVKRRSKTLEKSQCARPESATSVKNVEYVDNCDMDIYLDIPPSSSEADEEEFEISVKNEKENSQNITPPALYEDRHAIVLNKNLNQSSTSIKNQQDIEHVDIPTYLDVEFIKTEVKVEQFVDISDTKEKEPTPNITQSTLMKPITKDASVQADDMVIKIQELTIRDLIISPQQLNAFTGLVSFDLLDDIVKGVNLVEEKSFYVKLTTHDRVLLTLIKLKLDMSYVCMSAFFKISGATCKTYFHKTIQSLKLLLIHICSTVEEEILKMMSTSLHNLRTIESFLSALNMPSEKSVVKNHFEET